MRKGRKAEVDVQEEAVEHLKQAIAQGTHWYLALLEAAGLWTAREETRNGQVYRYLIDNEAFDWLLLAERLCQEADGLIPEEERSRLLLQGKPPLELSAEQFRELIGSAKYRAYLNYLYGVKVEEALLLTVEEEVRKESLARSEKKIIEEAYRRIYGATSAQLLRQFQRQKGYLERSSLPLSEKKEFTYWLFKYRLRNCDKARIASDTKKGLEKLTHQQQTQFPPSPSQDPPHTIEPDL